MEIIFAYLPTVRGYQNLYGNINIFMGRSLRTKQYGILRFWGANVDGSTNPFMDLCRRIHTSKELYEGLNFADLFRILWFWVANADVFFHGIFFLIGKKKIC